MWTSEVDFEEWGWRGSLYESIPVSSFLDERGERGAVFIDQAKLRAWLSKLRLL